MSQSQYEQRDPVDPARVVPEAVALAWLVAVVLVALIAGTHVGAVVAFALVVACAVLAHRHFWWRALAADPHTWRVAPFWRAEVTAAGTGTGVAVAGAVAGHWLPWWVAGPVMVAGAGMAVRPWARAATRAVVGYEVQAGTADADTMRTARPVAITARIGSLAGDTGWIDVGATRRGDGVPWAHVEGATPREIEGGGAVGAVGEVTDLREPWQRLGRRPSPHCGRMVRPPAGQRDRLLRVASSQRGLVVAASGHGKTVALSALVRTTLAQDAQVLVIDGKGGAGDARDLLRAGERAGVPRELVHWWHVGAGAPIDLLGGLGSQAVKVLEVAAGVTPAAATTGGAQFYALQRQAGLEALVRAGVSSIGEAAAWARRAPAQLPLEVLERRVDGSSGTVGDLVSLALEPVADRLAGLEGPGGWSPGDPHGWQLGVISADMSTPEGVTVAAAAIARVQVAIAERAGGYRRDLVVIVDECAAVLPHAGPALLGLYAQGRSAGVSLWTAWQDIAQAEREDGTWVQSAATSVDLAWVGRQANGGRLLEVVGGTSWANEATRPAEILPGAGTSVRTQRAHAIGAEVVETLPPWCWAIASAGEWRGAFVPPLAQG